MERYMMVSSDCHAGAPWYVYRRYLDPKYREDWDRWLGEHGAELEPRRSATEQPASHVRATPEEMEKIQPVQLSGMAPARKRQYLEEMEKSAGHLGNWDPDIRIRELDREGIAGEVIFCDGTQKNHPPFGIGLRHPVEPASYEHRLAGARAHNRWLAELCQTNPGRHAGIALVPLEDIEIAVGEIRWARNNGLFGGIMLRKLGFKTDGPENFWHHPRYEPVWRVCEELEMPLNAHSEESDITYGGMGLISMIELHWASYRAFWMLLCGGVFERHPNLQLAVTESGGLPVIWFNGYLDRVSTTHRVDEVRQVLSMKPSDYWFRQCYVGASAHTGRAEIDMRYKIGVKNIMWGSDYPHPEGTWPVSINRTKELFAGVPEEEVRLMIGENAARVYKFDLRKMRAIADKIGPKVSEISGDTA